MGVHDGHRERLRWRFIEHGLKNFNELNSLELLLFFAIPRRDTNELAHTLLARFGTLAGVFDASYEELTSVPGVGGERRGAHHARAADIEEKLCRAR